VPTELGEQIKMDKDVEEIFKQIQIHLNEQGAEMTALKAVLSGLVCRIVVSGPDPNEQLDQMKNDALGIGNRTPLNPQNTPNDAQLVEALVKEHVERFFRQLAIALEAMKNIGGRRRN
jgi:hypothetical protein